MSEKLPLESAVVRGPSGPPLLFGVCVYTMAPAALLPVNVTVPEIVAVFALFTVTVFVFVVALFPAASDAITLIVCVVPLVSDVVLQLKIHDSPTNVPEPAETLSIKNSHFVTATLSLTSRLISVFPDTVAPSFGESVASVGDVVSMVSVAASVVKERSVAFDEFPVASLEST